MLTVLFLIVLGIAYGDEMKSDVFNSTSGHFSADRDQSIPPNKTWTADIQPPNATDIFIVIEKMILGENDTMSIISNNKTLKKMNGTHDPFSFLVDEASLKIVVSTSTDQKTRRFAGYYTMSGCIYQINNTFGVLSMPVLSMEQSTINCSFTLVPQFKMFSKLSVTFLQFHLNKDKFQVIIDGIPYHNYTGDSVPPEIITDKKLEFKVSLNKNDTAKFAYENVLKDSENVELSNATQSHSFFYMPSSLMGYYPSGEECHWVTKSEENTTISFKFNKISVSSGATRVVINDGKNKFSSILFQVSSNNKKSLKNQYIFSSGNFLWISIIQPNNNTLVLGEVTMHRNGGYRKGSGKLSIPSNSTEVIYLLEEEAGENVVLNQHKGNLTANSTIYVYNDFSTDSLPVITYNTTLPHYPLVSSTSRMMVIAKDFTGNGNYEASFKGINEGCYKMSNFESGENLLSGNCNATCKWIVPPVENVDNVISLHLHPIIFQEQDVVSLSLLDATQTLITNITSRTKVLPEFYLPSSSGFLLNSIRGNCSLANDMLHGSFDKKKGCSKVQKLKPGNHLSVSSPNFPDRYPLWAHCWTNITTSNDTKDGHFLLTFNKIDLATTHCLIIRDNIGHSMYEGVLDILPGDLVLNDTASIEFSAQPCNTTKPEPLNLTTTSGFSLDVLSADCGDMIAKTKGNFSTPDFPKNTSAVICVWKVEVPEKGSIINFTLTKNDSKDFELKIYDGPSRHNETMKNQSTSMLLSRTNSLIFVYHRSNSSQTSPGIHVAFHSQECSTRCQNGECLHDDWKCNGINDCGDNSDEINCKTVPFVTTTPAPPPENKSYGVSPVAMGLAIPITFILGILAAIYLPPLIRRFRSGQYHQFRDVSADA